MPPKKVNGKSTAPPLNPKKMDGRQKIGLKKTRTDMNCTHCSKNFVALINGKIDGNHVVECPWCGHEHCRVVEKGVITSDRWDSRSQRIDVGKRNVWKSDDLQVTTSTAASFIRLSWLNKFSEQELL